MALKEIMAVIRPNKVLTTKKALDEIGITSFTAYRVLGRGKQGGRVSELAYPVSEDLKRKLEDAPPSFIPKRLLMIVVKDSDVDLVVQKIIRVNRTGEQGDGKIFVLPVDDALRLRTGEHGLEALI
ncbi:P-II family nitrogen regulator [Thermodesulforhabdus norvegica]|uniref:Nitrogen regulatory protein P-II family n=1 Tax=Thermodesulforhabdus norvegica TaxID=39841 RepID=A0A1I4UIM4_9BACT|nr:P-II family nitrogen regulator [Thermodesulforhabdus norvegica]SFM88844.1 nitrogen regulatory protein P-II family [Thermodesulforhabdus norvegica]